MRLRTYPRSSVFGSHSSRRRLESAFETGGEEVRRVGAKLAAEEIERVAEPEIEIALNDVERDAAKRARVALSHQLGRAFDDAPDAGLADEQMMRLFSEHELTGARERLEARLGERGELVLAVAVCEHREAVEVEPVVAGLVEGFEDARLVGVAAAARQHFVGLFAPIASEILVQQIDHRP